MTVRVASARVAGSEPRGQQATTARSVGGERRGDGQRTASTGAAGSEREGGGYRARGWRVWVASASAGVGNEGEGSEHGGVGDTRKGMGDTRKGMGDTRKGMGSECTGVGFEYGSEGSLWRASTRSITVGATMANHGVPRKVEELEGGEVQGRKHCCA
jgi:hypothetical protein